MATVGLMSLVLGGRFSTPFAERAGMDWQPANPIRAGTITVSHPKMYRREALINERKRDVEWLEKLMDDSTSVEFKPEIAREVEQITALAAGLGLTFDPASALNYRRAKETGDLQHEIDALKLQLQLDQLKRDAELVRSKFESQTEPVNADLGEVGAGPATAATSSASASAVDQLRATIEKLNAALTTRLDAEGRLAQVPGNIAANPTDVFRDRMAYRDILKSALNAARLDELHDLQGNALIRLSFAATVMPDDPLSAAPGVVQMRVAAPTLTPAQESRLYAGWLDYINENLNRNVGGVWTPKREVLSSAAAENFDVVEYRYARKTGGSAAADGGASARVAALAPEPAALPGWGRNGAETRFRHLLLADVTYGAPAGPRRPSVSRPPATRPQSAGKGPNPARRAAPRAQAVPQAAAVKEPTCPGLALDRSIPADPACSVLLFAAPRFRSLTANEGAFSSLANYAAFFNLKTPEDADRKRDFDARALLTPANLQALTGRCGLPLAPPVAAGAAPNAVQWLNIELARARIRVAAGDALANLTAAAERTLRGEDFSAPESEELALIRARTERARMFVAAFETAAYADCSDGVELFRKAGPELYVPPAFAKALKTAGERVSIYEVGPREQTQQMSTTARAANSLALALSVAAAQPGSGAAASAAASYSRQAMGRAQTLERLPAVVGYAQAPKGVFGWVLGPRATVDPRGGLELEQTVRPYDLTVDLSVPGWWPYFDLVVASRWAPGAAAIASGTLGNEAQTAIRVDMSQNSSDFEALTARLAMGDARDRRRAELVEVRGAVSACRPATIMLKGRSLWRASSILIAGKKIEGAAIGVLPDMSGVMVDAPALDTAVVGPSIGVTVPLSVLTPYGDALGTVAYVPKPGETCEAKKPAAAAADGPSVSSIEPLAIRVPAAVTFQVRGEKLNAYDKVMLHGQVGKVTLGKENKSLQVSFTAEQTAAIPQSRSVKLSFVKGDKSFDQTIEAIEGGGGN